MKKFFPIFAFTIFVAATTSAQSIRYGITGAMNVSSYAVEIDGISYNPESRIGFNVGFKMELDAPFIYQGFYFDMEALLSSCGATIESIDQENYVSNTLRPYYLEIPIHIGYRYDVGKNLGVFASFGPYFSVGLFGTNKLLYGTQSSKPDTFGSNGVKRCDFGLGLRSGVELFNHYRLFLGYDWGLIDIAKNYGGGTVNNRNFYIGACYMF